MENKNKKQAQNELNIELKLYGLDKFIITTKSFEDMYMKEKSVFCNDFELKTYNVMTIKDKFVYKEEKNFWILKAIKDRILGDLEIYKRIKEDNMFLTAGADIYEVIYRYESEAGKYISEIIESEFNKLNQKFGKKIEK